MLTLTGPLSRNLGKGVPPECAHAAGSERPRLVQVLSRGSGGWKPTAQGSASGGDMLPGSWWPSARCVLGGGRGRGAPGSLSRGLGSRTGRHAADLRCFPTQSHGGSGPNTRGTVTACSRVPSAKEMWGQANAEPRRQPCGRVRGRFVGLRELHGDSDSCSGSWRDPCSLSTKTGNIRAGAGGPFPGEEPAASGGASVRLVSVFGISQNPRGLRDFL